MSCCGNKRNTLKHAEALYSQKSESVPENKKLWEDFYFEYTGATALSVTGNISGKKYRFLFAGDRQLIDYRDASAMMAVPVLKRVRI
jgi:hypothetical protein